MRETIKKILLTIDSGIDYEQELQLIDNQLLDSLAIITLISELEDHFDITINPVEVVNDNFNSLDSMCLMVERLLANR